MKFSDAKRKSKLSNLPLGFTLEKVTYYLPIEAFCLCLKFHEKKLTFFKLTIILALFKFFIYNMKNKN